MGGVGRSVIRIGRGDAPARSGGRYEQMLAALSELRDHPCTRALVIGLQAHERHGRNTVVALAKTRVSAGRRDYVLFEEFPEWELEPDSDDRRRIMLECFVAEWPEDRALFALTCIAATTRRMPPRAAVRALIDEEKVLIQPAELLIWHAHWVGAQVQPTFNAERPSAQARRFFGRAAAATLTGAALVGCSTTADLQSSRPRYVMPVAFHMHQPADQGPVAVGTAQGMIPRTAEGVPLALHMHQPNTAAASKPVAPPTIASSSSSRSRPLAFHMHQPMAPLVLADVTATAGARPNMPQTAATEPVTVPAVVLTPEPARVVQIPNMREAPPAQPIVEEPQPQPPVTIALAPQRAAENVRPASGPVRVAPRGAAVFFARGVSVLSRDEAELLQSVASDAKSSRRIVITGRTDLTGAQRANEQIGLARANRVKSALVRLGVDPARIDVRVDTSGQAAGVPQALRTAGQPSDRAGLLRRVDIELVN